MNLFSYSNCILWLLSIYMCNILFCFAFLRQIYLILMMPDYQSICNKMQWQQNRCKEIHWNDKDGYFIQHLLKIHQTWHIIHQQSYCVLTHINWQNRPATVNLKLVSYQPIRRPGRYISPSLMYVTQAWAKFRIEESSLLAGMYWNTITAKCH